MKVTHVDTKQIIVPFTQPIRSALGGIQNCGAVLVFIHTDDGAIGENLVFTLNNRHTAVLHLLIKEMSELTLGQDIHHIADFWERAWKNMNFFGQKGISVMAISALDGALWDAVGKSCSLPLYRLLGGAHTHIPAYHSGGLWLDRSVDELVQEAHGMVEAGFRAVKMRLGSSDPQKDVERVRAVREAIGPRIELMADANQGLTESQAIRLGRMLEDYQLRWFEEPLPAWDHAGLARVSAALDTPIASGETEYTRYGFRNMLELKSADVLMPDLQRVGGVSEFMRVSHMAAAFDIPISSHIFTETSLQLLGAISNAIYLEYMPWFSDLYIEDLEFDQGFAVVPERPGWGFNFNLDYIAHLEKSMH